MSTREKSSKGVRQRRQQMQELVREGSYSEAYALACGYGLEDAKVIPEEYLRDFILLKDWARNREWLKEYERQQECIEDMRREASLFKESAMAGTAYIQKEPDGDLEPIVLGKNPNQKDERLFREINKFLVSNQRGYEFRKIRALEAERIMAERIKMPDPAFFDFFQKSLKRERDWDTEAIPAAKRLIEYLWLEAFLPDPNGGEPIPRETPGPLTVAELDSMLSGKGYPADRKTKKDWATGFGIEVI